MVSKVEDKKRDEEITYFEKLIEYNTEDLQENIDYIIHNKGNKKAIAYSMRNQFKELGIVEAYRCTKHSIPLKLILTPKLWL